MVNPLWQWDHIPQGMGISFHTYLPTVLTSSVVLVSFQEIPQRPKTGNIQIGPRQISWETHTISTITTYPSSCCFTDKCHAVDPTCGISVVGLGRTTQLQGQKDGQTQTHTPPIHTHPWLLLTCKHFWNFPGCWARIGLVSEELC